MKRWTVPLFWATTCCYRTLACSPERLTQHNANVERNSSYRRFPVDYVSGRESAPLAQHGLTSLTVNKSFSVVVPSPQVSFLVHFPGGKGVRPPSRSTRGSIKSPLLTNFMLFLGEWRRAAGQRSLVRCLCDSPEAFIRALPGWAFYLITFVGKFIKLCGALRSRSTGINVVPQRTT